MVIVVAGDQKCERDDEQPYGDHHDCIFLVLIFIIIHMINGAVIHIYYSHIVQIYIAVSTLPKCVFATEINIHVFSEAFSRKCYNKILTSQNK